VFGTSAVAAVRQLRRTPPGATAGIWHVAADGDSAVLKVVSLGVNSPRWPASPDPAHPYYWRREPCAYESGIAQRFGAPALRALVERDDGSVALWLEEVPEVEEWTPALLGEVARRLGRAQSTSVPDEPWLSRGWLPAYLDLHGVRDEDGVLDRLAALPQTLCHHDFHPANVLGPRADVIVDWAYCGAGALGLDAGVLVADGIADEAFAADVADDAADAVWNGYLAGLRDGGWSGDEDDVRFAYTRGTALRLSWLPRGERRAWDATIDFLQRLASTA
jgi:hypothetical protein